MREGRWCLLLPLFAAACAGVSTDPRTASVDDLPPAATDDTARAAALTAADASVAAYRTTRTTEAAEHVAAALGVSRATVYNLRKELARIQAA
jgi:transcriptional regulator of acetoin/glycerol metabolism